MSRQELHADLPRVVDKLTASIAEHKGMARLSASYLPSRDTVCQATDRLLELVFPGYFGQQGLTREILPYHVGELVAALMSDLFEPVRYCLRYRENEADCVETDRRCDEEARDIIAGFFDGLPGIRAALADDVQAAFDSDPAATSTDETIFSYPGLFAIAVQRLAHAFFEANVPLLPRVMTEYAHGRTGIDIHPGATIGRRFFIDHGTGVVIGETCEIGENVKVYQGVTLGALAPAYGQMLRGHKRHPTIESDVTIYAGATILGGETVVGAGCTIGGNVFLTESVPPRTTITAEPPTLKYRERRRKRHPTDDTGEQSYHLDFQI